MEHPPKTWKVGDLAKRTGLTVKTLHHYEEIGLLIPSARAANGYRIYTAADIARLQRIVSLKQLGFTLEQIRSALEKPEFGTRDVLAMHLEHARKQLKDQQQLLERLDGFVRLMDSRGNPSSEDLLAGIELMNAIEAHYTEEDKAFFAQRRTDVGDDRIREVEAEWPRLIAAVQAHMDKGTDPKDPAVQKLAKQWMKLVEEFTGGDPTIAEKVKKLYEEQPAARHFGPDPKMMEYIQRAQA